MKQSGAPLRAWWAYALLIGKVLLIATPMLLFLAALNLVPVAIENALGGRRAWDGFMPLLVTSLKLWAFFVAVVTFTTSLTFWFNRAKSVEATGPR